MAGRLKHRGVFQPSLHAALSVYLRDNHRASGRTSADVGWTPPPGGSGLPAWSDGEDLGCSKMRCT